jgi:hypothetical protein
MMCAMMCAVVCPVLQSRLAPFAHAKKPVKEEAKRCRAPDLLVVCPRDDLKSILVRAVLPGKPVPLVCTRNAGTYGLEE